LDRLAAQRLRPPWNTVTRNPEARVFTNAHRLLVAPDPTPAVTVAAAPRARCSQADIGARHGKGCAGSALVEPIQAVAPVEVVKH